MTKNTLLFGEAAREKMFAGIEKVFQAVGNTLGAAGRNAVFTRYGKPLITNDGVSIARRINLEDPFESLGADLIKQAADKTNDEAGDGTTTATILAYYLIAYGQRELKSDPKLSPMKLRRQLDDALAEALKALDGRAKQIESDEELLKIAKISAEDDTIATLVAEAVKKAGAHGRVIVEESANFEVEKDDIPGMELEGGFVSPYMVTHPDRMEAVLNKPAVLVTDRNFSLNKDLVPLLDELNRRGQRELLVVCRNMDSEVLATVITNRLKGLFHCVAVKTGRGKEWLEDLAALTNAETVTEEKGIKQITVGHLGRAKKVVVSKDKFLVIKDDLEDHEEKRFADRVAELEKQIAETKGHDKLVLQDRLARLTGSVVVIRSGAPTEAEMIYLKMKIDDAVCAVQAAVKEGYVTGGGLALFDVGRIVHEQLGTTGSRLLMSACVQPMQQLLLNAGVDIDNTKISGTAGYDLTTGEYVPDLAARGIIDPVIVEKSALKNAVSLAGMFLSVGTAIADLPEEKPTNQ